MKPKKRAAMLPLKKEWFLILLTISAQDGKNEKKSRNNL